MPRLPIFFPPAPGHTRRSVHASRGVRTFPAGLSLRAGAFLALLLLGCGPSEPAPDPMRAQGDPSAHLARVEFLLEQLRAPGQGTASDEEDRWHARRRATLAAMPEEAPRVGRALIERAIADDSLGLPLRRAAIEAGSLAADRASAELLVPLVLEFRADAALREAACGALARVDPELALTVFEPLLSERQPRTLPPAESMLEGYLLAARRQGADPVPLLTRVALALDQEENARVLAVRSLAAHDSPRAVAALRQVLVESTGFSYLRRIAAQGLVERLPNQELCRVLTDVLDREADIVMQQFLANMHERQCP